MNDDLQSRIEDAVKNPRNLGEMKDADAIGTVGSPDCGDMLRMWVKFKDEDGRKVIDRATFQTFGCQTAIAVASVACALSSRARALRRSSMSPAPVSYRTCSMCAASVAAATRAVAALVPASLA